MGDPAHWMIGGLCLIIFLQAILLDTRLRTIRILKKTIRLYEAVSDEDHG